MGRHLRFALSRVTDRELHRGAMVSARRGRGGGERKRQWQDNRRTDTRKTIDQRTGRDFTGWAHRGKITLCFGRVCELPPRICRALPRSMEAPYATNKKVTCLFGGPPRVGCSARLVLHVYTIDSLCVRRMLVYLVGHVRVRETKRCRCKYAAVVNAVRPVLQESEGINLHPARCLVARRVDLNREARVREEAGPPPPRKLGFHQLQRRLHGRSLEAGMGRSRPTERRSTHSPCTHLICRHAGPSPLLLEPFNTCR